MDQPPKPPDETAARVDGRREEDQAARLPGDLLADVLRRIPPRWLAAARCVCRAWRDAVDDRRLLRADLLPLSLAGLFVHFNEHKYPEFLARPSSMAGARPVSGDLSFLPSASPHCGYGWQEDCVDWGNYDIENHCNGLLLLRNNCVVNPATRWWNTLPRCPAKRDKGSVEYCARLAYDPMISPYYKVFMIPKLGGGNHRGTKVDPSTEESGWPPYTYKMYVFSSKSGCWEEKDFVREGDAEGAVGEAREAGYSEFSAVYFREALYVHCENDFLMRVSLPSNTYTVIKPPRGLKMEDYPDTTIARSEKGLYFMELDTSWIKDKCWLRVWFLEESCGQMEWILKHDKDFKHMLPHQWFCTQVKWILEDINYNLFRASSFPEDNKNEKNEEKFEWGSEEDVQDKDMVDHGYFEEKKALFVDIKILGFHPYKEIVFLSLLERTCLAYHLNGSKIEELGNIYPKEYSYFKELTNDQEKITSFPYTPCWMEAFPGKN